MSNTELTSIIRQLDQAFDKDPWYGKSIHSVLESVDPNQVFDPPAPDVHSIAELLAHIITYREFTVRRLAGDEDFLPDQEESFRWELRYPKRENAWPLLKNQLAEGHQKLMEQLNHHDDRLLERAVAGKPYSFRYLLNGILQHDLYHLGQIALIQKIQQQESGSGSKSKL